MKVLLEVRGVRCYDGSWFDGRTTIAQKHLETCANESLLALLLLAFITYSYD